MRLLLLLLLTFNLLHAKKIALLIGNSSYAKKGLINPTNDIDLLARKLSNPKLGFTVYKRPNLTKSQMIEELRTFYGQVDSNTIALIYFSGHGVHSTIDGKNYLIPIGAFGSLLNESQLSDVAVSDSYLLGSTDGAKFSILLLDACRSNDFAKTRGDKGLGQPQSGLKNDYIISYATDVGKTAEDGSTYSPYALALSHNLLGNYPIEELFRRVRKEVSTQTRGTQYPLYKPSFNERLCLTGLCTQKVVIPDNSQELARLRAENERLKNQRSRRVVDEVVVEPRTYSTKGITTIDGLMYQNQPFSSQDESNYKDNKNGGRVWDWKGAKKYCQDLTLGGYSGWRLPNRAELMKIGNIKLYNYDNYDNYDNWKKWFDKNRHRRLKGTKNSHFVKQEFIENMSMKYSGFWTSESKDSSYAWDVSFINGNDYWRNKTYQFYALCVR